MIFKHKRSGILYRKIMESFSTERQRPSVIYMALETGQVFDRDAEAFKENFRYVNNAQDGIVPKDLSAELSLTKPVVKHILTGPFEPGDVVRNTDGQLFRVDAQGTFRHFVDKP